MRGIFRLTLFKDIFIASGCGVGGGSLGYANTLYRARPAFFDDPQWGELADWERELAPHYETAERMLGVTPYDRGGARRRPAPAGVRGGDRRRRHLQACRASGVFFGEPGEEVDDPYFGGEGPRADGLHPLRQLHGRLPLRRQEHPRQELPLVRGEARRRDIPERQVTDIRPLGGRGRLRRLRGDEPSAPAPGCGAAAAHADARGAWSSPPGALGTNKLLAECRHRGSLPADLRAARRAGPHQHASRSRR